MSKKYATYYNEKPTAHKNYRYSDNKYEPKYYEKEYIFDNSKKRYNSINSNNSSENISPLNTNRDFNKINSNKNSPYYKDAYYNSKDKKREIIKNNGSNIINNNICSLKAPIYGYNYKRKNRRK